MAKRKEEVKINELRITAEDFLASYNQNIPEGFPHLSSVLMAKFRTEHPLLFKRDNLWSLDQHRKKLMDWLPREAEIK